MSGGGAKGALESVLLRVRVVLSACGDGFLTMLPAPGRSDRPVRPGVEGAFEGELALGTKLGMLDVGLVVMTTSSTGPPLVLGRGSSAFARLLFGPGEMALLGPGDSSRRKEDGNLDRGDAWGVPYLALFDLADGVDGGGDLGNSLSSVLLWSRGGRAGEPGLKGSRFGVVSTDLRSDSELRRFFLGGPVGMKLGCSPMVDKPRL